MKMEAKSNSYQDNIRRATAAGIPILQVIQWVAAHWQEIMTGATTLYAVISQLIAIWQKDHPTS